MAAWPGDLAPGAWTAGVTPATPAAADREAPPASAADPTGLALLVQVFDALREEGVQAWLDAGSCLRAVRNGVPWSTDVDLGMWRDDYEAVIRAVARLRRAGFQVRWQGGMPYFDDHVTLFPPIGTSPPYTNIDLVLYRRIGDEAVKANSSAPDYGQPLARVFRRLLRDLRRERYEGRTLAGRIGNLLPLTARRAAWRSIFAVYRLLYRSVCFVAPAALFERLRGVDIDGVVLPAPEDAEAYLEFRYGADWRQPKPGWRLSDGQVLRIRPIRGIASAELLRSFQTSDEIVWHKRVTPRGSFEFTPEEVERIRARDRKD